MKYTKMTKMMEKSVGSRSFRALPLAVALLASGASMAADEATKAETKVVAAPESIKMAVEKKAFEEEKDLTADEYYKMGRNDYTKGDFLDAIDSLLKAKDVLLRDKEEIALSDSEKDKLEKIRNLLNDAYYGRAQELFRDAEKNATAGNYDEAVKLCKDAKENFPGCAEIMDDMIRKYETLKSNVEYNDSVAGENIDPNYKDRDLDIQKEMRKGQNFYKIGQWAKARDHFNAVLQLDPYNEMAIDYMRRCYEKLIQTGSARHEVIAQERLSEVNWSAVSPIMSLPADTKPIDPVVKKDKEESNSGILKKLKDIKIAHLNFEEQSLADAVDALRKISKEQDPEKKGVNILLILNEETPAAVSANAEEGGDTAAATEEKVEGAEGTAGNEGDSAAPGQKYMIQYVNVDDISLQDAIDLVCRNCKAGDSIRVYVEPDAVLICDGSVVRDEYELAVFEAEKGWFDEYTEGAAVEEGADANDPDLHYKTYFRNRGILFPAGSGVKFDETLNRLIVNNTKEANLQIQAILEEKRNQQTNQVLVQVKFVEISLTDLEELGFEYTISRENDSRSEEQSMIDYLRTETAKADGVYYSKDAEGNTIATLSQPRSLVYYRDGIDTSESFEPIAYGEGEATYNPSLRYGNDPVELREGSVVNLGKDPTGYYIVPSNSLTRDADGNLANTKIYGSAVTFKQNDNIVRNASATIDEEGNINYEGRKVFTDMENGYLPDNDTAVHWNYSDNNGFKAGVDVHALDQADSSDVLSAPRIVTVSEQEATIRMVTERYFPQEWGEADVSTNDNIMVFQPSNPTFKDDPFEEGIILSVTPNVQDGGLISMFVKPVIQEFIGWTDYSYNVPYKDPRTSETIQAKNTVKMPITTIRSVETNTVISNGETMVLGGIITDTLRNIDDQYPILGDLPLVGRLFQSKSRSGSKINLLIFMTCTLVKPDGTPVRQDSELRGVPAFRY